MNNGRRAQRDLEPPVFRFYWLVVLPVVIAGIDPAVPEVQRNKQLLPLWVGGAGKVVIELGIARMRLGRGPHLRDERASRPWLYERRRSALS